MQLAPKKATPEREEPEDLSDDGDELEEAEDLAAAGLGPSSVEEDRLKCEIARLTNAGDKLRYSNEELDAALAEAPGDEDFMSAVQENKDVMAGFAKKIAKMEKELEVLLEISGAFPPALGPHASEDPSFTAPGAAADPAPPVQMEMDENGGLSL